MKPFTRWPSACCALLICAIGGCEANKGDTTAQLKTIENPNARTPEANPSERPYTEGQPDTGGQPNPNASFTAGQQEQNRQEIPPAGRVGGLAPVRVGLQGSWVVTTPPPIRLDNGIPLETFLVFSGNNVTASIGSTGSSYRKVRFSGTYQIDKSREPHQITMSVRHFSGRQNKASAIRKNSQPFELKGNTLIIGTGAEKMILQPGG